MLWFLFGLFILGYIIAFAIVWDKALGSDPEVNRFILLWPVVLAYWGPRWSFQFGWWLTRQATLGIRSILRGEVPS